MAKFSESSVLKKPNITSSYSALEIRELMKCSDPINGPLYFMSNYCYIQHPTRGKILYKPYSYQIGMVGIFQNYRYSCNLVSRQMGKTATAALYLLWVSMFNPDQTVLIAANKMAGASEIISRVKFAYENCPDFVRAGVLEYNKQSIVFDNGSRLIAQSTTPTTGRGLSISMLYCADGETSFVTIKNKQTEEIENISMLELYNRLVNKNTSIADNMNYSILSSNGWKDFKGISCNRAANKKAKKIIFEDNSFVIATLNHKFLKNDKWITVKELKTGDSLQGDNTSIKIKDIKEDTLEDTYDFYEVDGHEYILNGVITHNCDELAFVRSSFASEFWSSIVPTLSSGGRCIITSTPNSSDDLYAQIWFGANDILDEYGDTRKDGIGKNGFKAFSAKWDEHPDRDQAWADEQLSQLGEEKYRREVLCEFVIAEETLINSIFLSAMQGSEPLYKTGQTRWYKKPEKEGIYIVALDPSMGTGGDPAAIEIFDARSHEQIGEWTHNKTGIEKQIEIMKEIVGYLSDISGSKDNVYYSVENNTLGEANLVAIRSVGEENINGYFLSEPHVRSSKIYRKGFNTTPTSKLATCSRIKTEIEMKKMAIHSKKFISELKCFVSNGNSYKAKPGKTDDLVMAGILGIRMLDIVKNFLPIESVEDDDDEFYDFDTALPFIYNRY
jgi:hypothetical protein